VALLLIGSVLLGAVLGRFFKVWVLVPACAFVLGAVLVRSANGEHVLLRPLFEFAALIISLQIGYVSGLLSFLIPSGSHRQVQPRRPASFATSIAATAPVMPGEGPGAPCA
jgi:hypothetical protein